MSFSSLQASVGSRVRRHNRFETDRERKLNSFSQSDHGTLKGSVRKQWVFTLFLFLCLSGLSQSAFATYFSLTFNPASPVEGQVPDALVRVGVCDSLSAPVNAREIEVEGNIIRITAVGITQTVLPCNFSTITATYSLVPLQQGTYRVEFYRRQFQAPNIVDLMIQEMLVVRPAPPLGASEAVNIPGLSWHSGIPVLLIAIFVIALLRIRSAK